MKKMTFIIGLAFVFFAQDLWAQPTGRRIDAVTLSVTQMSNLATAMLNYIDQDIIEEHSCNNEFGNAQNATGSLHGPELFLNWHRYYLAEMEADPGVIAALAAIPGSGGLIPRWTRDDGLTTPGFSVFQAIDADCAASCGSGACGTTPTGTLANTYPYTNPLPCNWTDFVAFNQDLQYGYHNQGHNSLGGIMASFKSPATPIFWLWHGLIDDVYWDFQNECVTAGDLHLKDTPSDNASEPNNISATLYQSQDIWVRQNQDTPTGGTGIPHGSTAYSNEGIHENPEFKMTGFNYIYVRIRNESPDEFAGGRLRVYWSKASTGLNWPVTWNDHFVGGVIHGDQVTPDNPFVAPTTQNPTGMPIPLESNFVIPPIAPNSQFIMEIPWVVPNPADYTVFGTDIHHFCLLARMVSPFDEMDTPEGSALWLNVKNNNNIAWKNVQIYDLDPLNIVDPGGNVAELEKQVDFMGVYVSNFDSDVQQGNLEFKAEKGKNGTFYDIGGRVYARMSVDLFKLWDQAGYDGENIKILGELNEKYYVELTEPTATMKGMMLEPKKNYALEMGYTLTKQVKGGQNFGYDVCQNDGKDPVGGERYEIRIKKPRIRSGEVASLEVMQLTVAPNPAKDQFTVSYNLQTAGKVSMTLFDISGRIVNQTLEQDLPAGYQTELVDASNLVNGIYILRVQVGQKVMNQKVVIE